MAHKHRKDSQLIVERVPLPPIAPLMRVFISRFEIVLLDSSKQSEGLSCPAKCAPRMRRASKRVSPCLLSAVCISILLICAGCSTSNDSKAQLKVGMTYDEVERILGKPGSIGRGANQIPIPDISLSSEYGDSLDVNKDLRADPKYRDAPPHIHTTGQLLYVTWIYPEVKRDTFYCTFFNLRRVQYAADHLVYHINGQIVQRWLYDEIEDLAYCDPSGRIISEVAWEGYRNVGRKVPRPTLALKTVERDLGFRMERVRNPLNRRYFVIVEKFCVIFDAASGRVSQSGFFPFEVTYIN